MPDVTAEQIAASEPSAAQQPSEPAQHQEPAEQHDVATDTTERVEETDEQKNAREVAERRERSEKRAKGVQRRFDELTREKYEERQRGDRLERMVEQLVGQKVAPAQQPAADVEPARQDYSDYEDFVAAKAEYRATKKAREFLETRLNGAMQASQHAQAEQQAVEMRRQFVARQQDFAKQVPDYFETVTTEDVRVPESVATLLHTMDDAPAVIYAMAKHPQIAARLWNEPPARQAILLGQLSALLRSSSQVSKAPEPGKPTGARSGESGSPPADMDGYMKWRAKSRSARNA